MRLFLAIPSENLLWYAIFRMLTARSMPTSVTQHCEPRLLIINKCFSRANVHIVRCPKVFLAQVL